MPQEAPAGNKFSQKQRLKQTWEFERVRKEGRRLVKGCLILNWRLSAEEPFSKLGVISSGKMGNATERSRARRLMREVFRLNQHKLVQPAELVLVARPSIVGKTFQQVERDFLSLLNEAKLLANKG